MDRQPHANIIPAAIAGERRRHKHTIPSASDAPTQKYIQAGGFPGGMARARAAARFIVEMMDDEDIAKALAGKKTRSQHVLMPSNHDGANLAPARPALEALAADRDVAIPDIKDILYALCREATKAYRADDATDATRAKFAELLNLATLALGNIKIVHAPALGH